MSNEPKDPNAEISEPAGDQPTVAGAESPIRREFLTKSALFLAVLGLGDAIGADEAGAQPQPGKAPRLTAAQVRAVRDVVNDAARLGSMEGALKEQATKKKSDGLPEGVKTALARLTPDDLRAVMVLKTKLSTIDQNVAADNNGVVIM